MLNDTVKRTTFEFFLKYVSSRGDFLEVEVCTLSYNWLNLILNDGTSCEQLGSTIEDEVILVQLLWL